MCCSARAALDATFNGTGKVLTSFPFTTFDAAAAVALAGGKVYAAGSSSGNFAVARYNANGTLDTTFGGGTGRATVDFGNEDGANAIAVQSDGKVLVAGSTADPLNDPTVGMGFAVARFDANGTLDTTFGGGDGKQVLDIPGFDFETARAVALLAGNKFLVAGQATGGNDEQFAIARFNADGSLDATFGVGGTDGNGVVTTDFGPPAEGRSKPGGAAAIGLLAGGKFVVGGGSDVNFALAQYNADGTLDSAFGGGDGKVTTDIDGFTGFGNDAANALAIAPGGKIVLAGRSGGDFAVVRYDANGSPDASFGGGDGIVTTSFPTTISYATDSARRSAWRPCPTAGSSLPARRNPPPALNPSRPRVTLPWPGTTRTGAPTPPLTVTVGWSPASTARTPRRAVALQSDGKMVAAGSADSGGGDFALTRYLTNGA